MAFQSTAFQIAVPDAVVGGGAGARIFAPSFSKKRWRELLAERKKEREAIEAKQYEDEAVALLLLADDRPASSAAAMAAALLLDELDLPDLSDEADEPTPKAPATEVAPHRFRGDEDDDELAALMLLLS